MPWKHQASVHRTVNLCQRKPLAIPRHCLWREFKGNSASCLSCLYYSSPLPPVDFSHFPLLRETYPSGILQSQLFTQFSFLGSISDLHSISEYQMGRLTNFWMCIFHFLLVCPQVTTKQSSRKLALVETVWKTEDGTHILSFMKNKSIWISRLVVLLF